MAAKHHILNWGEAEEYHSVYFTIDFEPVEVRLPSALYDSLFTEDFTMSRYEKWGILINTACRTIGKDERKVVAINTQMDKGRQLESFGATVFEYIGSSGYGWAYFAETKTQHINKFFNWWESDVESSNAKSITFRNSFNWWHHYEQVQLYLKKQGLSVGKRFYEIPSTLIDQLTKTIMNHDNNKRAA